jgi:hypothetical protein
MTKPMALESEASSLRTEVSKFVLTEKEGLGVEREEEERL